MKDRMNWDQARAATDAGKTRDKVKNAEVAAAPLGTDEEAGGASTSERDIARTVNRQIPPPEND